MTDLWQGGKAPAVWWGTVVECQSTIYRPFRDEDIRSLRLDFGGLTVSVATPEILYRMR
ncbi:MAG: hypothetical protein ACRD21_09870 [Vicinamibacteria bacterium]